jgi:hypothetical protein
MPQDTLEQLFQKADAIPGVAKVSSPRRRAKVERDRTSSPRSSGRSAGSSRCGKPYYSDMGISDRKIDNERDAKAWGRLAAVLSSDISPIHMASVMELEFHAIALDAYEAHLIKLNGAPF